MIKHWYYSFADSDESNKFRINPENGNIVVAQTLDWETKNFYNLTVQVTDGVHQVQTWVSSLKRPAEFIMLSLGTKKDKKDDWCI